MKRAIKELLRGTVGETEIPHWAIIGVLLLLFVIVDVFMLTKTGPFKRVSDDTKAWFLASTITLTIVFVILLCL